MLVINKTGTTIRLVSSTRDLTIPYSGKEVEVPDEFYATHKDSFQVIIPPSSVFENNPNIAHNKPKTLSQTTCVKAYKDYVFDLLYSFHFDDKKEIPAAIKRLDCSIGSIYNQKVRVCICNTGKYDISTELANLPYELCYIFEPTKESYCKSKTINLGVKFLVQSEYFFLSDIDLIYDKKYVESMKKYLYSIMPVRVITTNRNLGYEFYSKNKEDYWRYLNVPDPFRSAFGISPGNGLVHLDSFWKINGFDEAFTGYAQEDSDFNDRISFLCNYIEDDRFDVSTLHLFHSKGTMSEQNLNVSTESKKQRMKLLNILTERPFNEKTDLKYIQGAAN